MAEGGSAPPCLSSQQRFTRRLRGGGTAVGCQTATAGTDAQTSPEKRGVWRITSRSTLQVTVFRDPERHESFGRGPQQSGLPFCGPYRVIRTSWAWKPGATMGVWWNCLVNVIIKVRTRKLQQSCSRTQKQKTLQTSHKCTWKHQQGERNRYVVIDMSQTCKTKQIRIEVNSFTQLQLQPVFYKFLLFLSLCFKFDSLIPLC